MNTSPRKPIFIWWGIVFLVTILTAILLGFLTGCSSEEASYMVETRDSDPNSVRLDLRTGWGGYRGVEIRAVLVKGHWVAVALRDGRQVAICELTEGSKVEK